MKPTITTSLDSVMIEGRMIPRPKRITPSEWLEFWNATRVIGDRCDENYEEGYRAGVHEQAQEYT